MSQLLFRRGCASSVTPFFPDGRLRLERLNELIAVESGLPSARAGWRKLAPLIRLQFQAYHSKGEGAHGFSTMKAALNLIGPPVGDPQPPIQPLPATHRQTLAKMLVDLGYEVRLEEPA